MLYFVGHLTEKTVNLSRMALRDSLCNVSVCESLGHPTIGNLTMRSRSYVILSLLAILLGVNLWGASSAKAQWALINSLESSPVTAVYFMSNPAPPAPPLALNGFMGFQNGKAYRTQDGGVTWAAIPGWSASGPVTNFSFKDANVGFASVLSSSGGGCFKTIDGGKTWTALASSPNGANSVYYNTSNSLCFLAIKGGNMVVSADDGATWTTVGAGFKDISGFAFTDGNHGIASTNTNAGTFLRTANGGTTWTAINNFPETSWQPAGVPGSSTFFVSTIGTATVFRSTDYGVTWAVRGVLKPGASPTGTIMGNRCRLYAQEISDLFVSTDEGLTWVTSGTSAPGNFVDTRFWVTDQFGVFAGDNNGNLKQLAVSNPRLQIRFPTRSFKFTQGSCSPKTIAVPVTACRCDGPIQLSSVSFTGSGGSKYSLDPSVVLPSTICDSTSILFNYTSSTNSYDTSLVVLTFNTGSGTADTSFYMFGHSDPLGVNPSDAKVNIKLASACQPYDTVLVFNFNSCDSVFLTGLRIDDSSAFQLDRDNISYATTGNGSLLLRVHANAPTQGLSGATITMTLTSGSSTEDIKIPLQLNALASSNPRITSFTNTFTNGCAVRDTFIVIRNSFCDTLHLKKLNLLDSTVYGLVNPGLPVDILPGDSLVIRFHAKNFYQRGTYPTRLVYQWVNLGVTTDNQITLSTTIQNTLPLTVTATPNSFSFGNTSLCGSRAIWMKIKNTLCSDLTITSVTPTFSSPDFSLSKTITTPRVLKPGQTDSILVDFVPSSSGSKSGTVNVGLTRDAETATLTYNVTGNGVTSSSASFTTETLTFDSTLICTANDTVETYLRNESCDSVQITQFKDQDGNDFSLLSPPVGTWVKKGDSVLVKVIITPQKGGNLSERFDVRVQPKGGSELPLTLTATGFIQPGVRNAALSSSTLSILDSIAACSTVDTVITITNLGQCDTLVINNIQAGGSTGLTILNPPTYPAKLLPGESVKFTVQIDPGQQTDIAGTVTISANPDITIPVHAVAHPCNNSARLTLSQSDPTFNAPSCKKIQHEFVLTSTGTSTATIDQVTLTSPTGSTHWRLVAPASTPVNVAAGSNYSVIVEYDPEGTGDNTATLTITSNGASFSQTLSLSGSDAGHPTVRLGVKLANGQAGTVNLQDPVSIEVYTMDDIPDGLGLQDASFTLHYNNDILFNPTITAENGWTIASQQEGAHEYALTLNHGAGAVPQNTTIASVKFGTILSDSTQTTVYLGQTIFNKNDQTFEHCTLSSAANQQTVDVHVNIECFDSAILNHMRGAQVNSIRIRPNPVDASSGNGASVAFDLYKDAHVTVQLIDPLGRLADNVLDRDLTKGSYNVPFHVKKNAEGWYLITVTANGIRQTEKVILTGTNR